MRAFDPIGCDGGVNIAESGGGDQRRAPDGRRFSPEAVECKSDAIAMKRRKSQRHGRPAWRAPRRFEPAPFFGQGPLTALNDICR